MSSLPLSHPTRTTTTEKELARASRVLLLCPIPWAWWWYRTLRGNTGVGHSAPRDLLPAAST